MILRALRTHYDFPILGEMSLKIEYRLAPIDPIHVSVRLSAGSYKEIDLDSVPNGFAEWVEARCVENECFLEEAEDEAV